MPQPTALAANTAEIRPEALFTLSAFIRSSGISKTRIAAARRQGIRLRTLEVGRRVFVRGADGIEFIEQLAVETERRKALDIDA